MHGRFRKGFGLAGILILAVLFSGTVSATDKYKIDPTHSTLGFAVPHVLVGITRGRFTDYSGTIQFDKDNLPAFRAEASIKSRSINTGLEVRDKHLRSADFFDVEKYPTITFKSKNVVKKGDRYQIVGEFTIRGMTREVSGLVDISGPVRTPFGTEVIGIHGGIVINRQDFGITWNSPMPHGGFVVGNEVRIIIDIEAHKK